MYSNNQIKAIDLPAESFPITIKAFNKSGECVWEETLVEAPLVLEVPALAKIHGPVDIKVYWPHGEIDTCKKE